MSLSPFEKIHSIEDDGDFARRVFEGFWPTDGHQLKNQDLFERVIEPLAEFEFGIALNGFISLFDQAVDPEHWPEIEAFLTHVGASEFSHLLTQARRIYFGGDELPNRRPSAGEFRSKLWEDPGELESQEFDRITSEAESLLPDAIRRVGVYLRGHWDEIY